eukprot:2555590-Pleurochrysis_carterae.AAC.1
MHDIRRLHRQGRVWRQDEGAAVARQGRQPLPRDGRHADRYLRRARQGQRALAHRQPRLGREVRDHALRVGGRAGAAQGRGVSHAPALSLLSSFLLVALHRLVAHLAR